MDHKKILNGVLAKTLNIAEGKIAELYKEGENEISEDELISKILKLDVDRIKVIKDENGREKFQEGFKKDKKEIFEKFENELKEKFNIESSNMGIDLINEILVKNSKPGTDVTEDAIRKSKLFLDLEANSKAEAKRLKEVHQEELNQIKSNYEGEKIFSTVNKKAMEVLKGLNPILPGNQNIADNQINAFLDKFKDFNFELQEDRIVVLDKDKRVVQDEHGNTINFDDIVKDKASNFWELSSNNGGSGSGNAGQGGEGGNGGSSIKVPSTLKELADLMNDSNIDGSEKLKLAEEFEKNNN